MALAAQKPSRIQTELPQVHLQSLTGKRQFHLGLKHDLWSKFQMENQPHYPPPITFNRSFLEAFISEMSPCLALRMIEIEEQQYGLFALSLEQPLAESAPGFNFGTQLLGTSQYEVILLTFEFYEFQRYNILINPNNPVIQQVLKWIIESNDYFFLALGEQNQAIIFRPEPHHDALYYLVQSSDRILNSCTTDEQYLQAVTSFMKNPQPPGKLLRLVCHDNLDYLDLSRDRIEMKPLG